MSEEDEKAREIRKGVIYEMYLSGTTSISEIARKMDLSRQTIYNDIHDIKDRNREWFDKNEVIKDRARENLKQILDSYDLVLRSLWEEFNRIPVVISGEDGSDVIGPILAKSRILEGVRKTLDSKTAVMSLHGMSMREMEIQKQIKELEEKQKELVKLREERWRVTNR